MPSFSDRMAITEPPTEIQVNSMNEQLRNSLWNLFMFYVAGWSGFLRLLFYNYYKEPVDSLPVHPRKIDQDDQRRNLFKQKFYDSEWYEVYNIIQHIIENYSLYVVKHRTISVGFHEALSRILERELSGYRVIKDLIVPISNEHEVESIRQATSTSSSLGLDGVNQHITESLKLLGKKPDPDYRNSIKESISAVESLCKRLTGVKSGGLDKALKKLSEKVSIHTSLKQGFLKLYAYSSNEDGIRHAILESSDIGFSEAKFMLVSCSAFVNFVIEKSTQADLFK